MEINHLEQRILALRNLGLYMVDFYNHYQSPRHASFYHSIRHIAEVHPWFTEQGILDEITHWGERLTLDAIQAFSASIAPLLPKNILYVMSAQETPLAGFFEMICAWLTQSQIIFRGNTSLILQTLADQLVRTIDPNESFAEWNQHAPKTTTHFVVHLQNDNTQALKQYFTNRNALLIENRMGIAILHPDDDTAIFESIGYDIFHTFGQSPFCVRKLYVPEGYRFDPFFEAIEKYHPAYQNNKYANNYDYHRSILLMDRKPFLDNGFVIIRESDSFNVPIGCLYFEYYHDLEKLRNTLSLNAPTISQIISSKRFTPNVVRPGFAHRYALGAMLAHENLIEFLNHPNPR